ncbi:MlaD family protein [Glaciimonas sp. Gout2]|uniref:PqiB family protein n=2 Tax=Glaciimonas TaxID=1229970 RepID=UPI002AB409C5|nr:MULTISPECIES: MlaD family protein [unclassified Glaciimonas]MDY7548785.1 MlaD family protein [Glaciimonas sp. CA11.2]MEB0012432.1 MlaD family protein [Glaciimonas sp. Cout2]MEB0082639.1 MlaD family protein [Glaciimonas sp. Gout2]
MTEEKENPSLPDLPTPRMKRQRNWLPSLVWLIPIVAALVGLTLVAKIIVERGPVITVTFITAEGLEAGKTKVKYKDVDIGTVEKITLSKDHSHIIATIQLLKEAKSFTAMDARFWVVRPRVAASGISGLGTLLSGAYIGADAGNSTETKDEFTGLEVQPIVTRDSTGLRYLLHASDIGSLDIGSPIYYRRIKVGQVAAYDLDNDGKGVTLRIFINAPYQKFVGANTRFWHASGFDMQISSSGFKLRTESLATVVLGGIAMQSPDDNIGTLAKENTAFGLAEDQSAAMKPADGPPQTVLLYFNQSLRGLSPGATVDFRGVELGEVKSIGVEYDTKKREFLMPVLIQIYPERLGRRMIEDERESPYTQQQRLQYMISRGLRAQLRTGNLLTGQIYVALDFFPKAPAVKFDVTKAPLELPTIPNSLDEIQSQIADIARKLSKVPFDQIGTDLQKTLGTLNRTLTNTEKLTNTLNTDIAPDVSAAMKDLRKTLSAAQQTLSSDAPLQQDIRQTLQELSRSAASLRVLTDYLERHPESLIRGKQEDKK